MSEEAAKKRGNPEVRLLMRILAILGFVILLALVGGYIFLKVKAPYLMEFSEGVEEQRIEIELDSLAGAHFVQGMSACENLWLDPLSLDVYVTSLDGKIYHLAGPSRDSLNVVSSVSPGSSVTGICRADSNSMAAMINSHAREEWIETGGAVNLMTMAFDSITSISADYPSANGICCDRNGNLYFASSNFKFLHPEGNIYLMEKKPDGTYKEPTPLFENAGLANGLYYDITRNRIYFSNTIGGVYSFSPGDTNYHVEYLKTRFMESCDDLCTDVSGNLWMTDPGNSTVKVYNPGTGRLVRFVVRGIGQTSSCRIRNEGGREIVYLTELKQQQKPMSQTWDGRGLLIIPANDLLSLININTLNQAGDR